MNSGEVLFREGDRMDWLAVIKAGDFELKKTVCAAGESGFYDSEMLRKQQQGLWKTRGKQEVVLGKVGAEEVVGEEGLLAPGSPFQYTVTCRSCQSHVWLFKVSELLQHLPVLATTWKRMIEQKQASHVQAFRKGYWVMWAKTQVTGLAPMPLDPNRAPLPSIPPKQLPDFPNKSLRRNPTSTQAFQRIGRLRHLDKAHHQSLEQVMAEATLFLGATPNWGRSMSKAPMQRMSTASSLALAAPPPLRLKTILGHNKTLALTGSLGKLATCDPGLTFTRIGRIQSPLF